MIVRDFLQWIRTAPASERAEATSALARAYLYSDLSPDDLGAAEGAMLMLLDDPSPLVRRSLADALAASPNAPPAIVLALAADQPQIAAPVYALSPLFVDADLVDAVATGGAAIQAAIASRAALAALRRRRDRRSRHRRILPDPGRKFRRRHRAVLDRPHRRALRPSGRDPRGALAARRYSRRDAADARHQTVRDAGRLCRRPRLARCRSCPARRARGLREGDRHDCRRRAADRTRSADPPFVRRADSSPPASFCARCCPAISRCSRRRWPNSPTCRSRACRGSFTTAAASGLRALFEKAQLPPSTYPGVQGSDRGDARRLPAASRAARRGSSGA